MVDLANRGHLEVFETQVGAHQRLSRTQFELSRTLAPPDDLAPYQELLLESLFELSNVVPASDLRHRFYTQLTQLEHAVFASMAPKVFAEYPAQVHRRYRTFGTLLALFGAFALTLPLDPALCRELALALAAAGGLLAVCSRSAPRSYRHGQAEAHNSADIFTAFGSTWTAMAKSRSRGASQTSCRSRSSSGVRTSGSRGTSSADSLCRGSFSRPPLPRTRAISGLPSDGLVAS